MPPPSAAEVTLDQSTAAEEVVGAVDAVDAEEAVGLVWAVPHAERTIVVKSTTEISFELCILDSMYRSLSFLSKPTGLHLIFAFAKLADTPRTTLIGAMRARIDCRYDLLRGLCERVKP
jgi:hypothetical protein